MNALNTEQWWSGMTLPQMLEYRTGKSPDDVAYRVKGRGLWKPTTWGEYRNQVEFFALGLLELGLEPQTNVAVIGDNWPQHLISDLAAQAIEGSGIVLFPESTSE